jgi:GDP-L-fucose synthase
MNKLSTLLEQHIISFKDNYPEIASLHEDMKEHKHSFLEKLDAKYTPSSYWVSHGHMLDTGIGNASKDISILDLGTQFGFMPHFLKSIGFTNVSSTNSYKEASTGLPDLKLCWDSLLEVPPIDLHIKPQKHFILPKKYDVILCSQSNILWKSDKVLKYNSKNLLTREAFSYNIDSESYDVFFTPYDVDDIEYLMQNLRQYLNVGGKAVVQPFPFPYYLDHFEKELRLIKRYQLSSMSNYFHERKKKSNVYEKYLDYFIIPKDHYYIAGDRGLVGKNYINFLKQNCSGGNTSNIDYTNIEQTREAIKNATPSYVVINAASVGGLLEDLDRSFELLLRNLKIQNNLFEVCAENNIKRVLLQGSTCSYPEHGKQPFTEDQLMCGPPFDGYLTTALPKLIGMYQCRASNDKRKTKWRTAINTNLFGPGDRTGKHAHAVGALMQKFVNAIQSNCKEIEIWGSGNQSRDILYIKDAICAMDIILKNDRYDTVNVASGVEITIKELVEHLIHISKYKGKIWFNTDKPEGVKNRAIDNSRLKDLGWNPEYTLEDALAETYKWYYDNT